MEENKQDDIIIDLSNIRARKYHERDGVNHILLDSYYEKIAELINDRINEIENYKSLKFDIDNINEVKMHDAILVYGSRGNGKSTVMINLQDFITGNHVIEKAEKLKNRVKIFETIDPTIQEEDEDFLLVILSSILKEVENYKVDKYNKRDAFYDSLENVLKIVEATRSKKKDDIDVFDKFYGLKSGVGLAEELHRLFKYTKDIFEVDILIIPIDDVDMNLKQGYQIADSIRKYMSSPYIIPIVAFNIRQMRVVTKYNKYKVFGLKIDYEIELEELSFLRSLPNDYLSKVFPPNRRIYLKSVFEILQEAENKEKIIYFQKKDIKLKSFDMTSLVSELFYESHYNSNTFDDSTFLSTRSMRNFLNDCYSVLSSLTLEENEYKINRKIIKDRLAPDDIPSFVTKEHALTWLWNKYIKIAKINLLDTDSTQKSYNWAKIVTETLPEDNSAEIINKKTYARIWLQEYYRIDEKVITTTKYENREYILNKKCDIVGALELAMRSYIPMYLFENIVRNHNLEYNHADLIYLKSFSTRSLQGIAYELSMMETSLYKPEYYDSFNHKPIGSIVVYEDYNSITNKEFNIPFLFKVANQDKIDDTNPEQLYIISIFKSLALFIELMKIYNKKEDNQKEDYIKALLEKYRVNMPSIDSAFTMKDNYYNECINQKYQVNPIREKGENITSIDFEHNSFGILEIAKFSKRLVDFFMNVRDNINVDLLSYDISSKNKGDEFYSPIITYFTSFAQSLFISLFSSIKEDNLLLIRASKKSKQESKVIFRKNTLYGTKDNTKPKNDDHLYQENICNLKEIVDKNREYKDFNKTQIDFYDFFNYINNDIPFFNFLINKAEFLDKIKKECKTDASN